MAVTTVAARNIITARRGIVATLGSVFFEALLDN